MYGQIKWFQNTVYTVEYAKSTWEINALMWDPFRWENELKLGNRSRGSRSMFNTGYKRFSLMDIT